MFEDELTSQAGTPAAVKLHFRRLERQLRKVRTSPIVQRRMLELMESRRTGNPRMTRIRGPLDAIAEKELLVLGLLISPESFEKSNGLVGMKDQARAAAIHKLALLGLSSVLSKAQIYIWKHEMRHGALGMTLPTHIFSGENWPYPVMWWTFESAIGHMGEEDRGLQGILLYRTAKQSHLVMYSADDEGKFNRVGVETFDDGMRLSEDDTDALHRSAGDMAKMLAFLESRYVVSEPERLDRSTRRQMIRAKQKEESEETVRVVKLRSPDTNPISVPSEGDGIEWANRWWVRGHLRAQWCPSTSSHKLIWVAPYLKGPEDLPIATKVYQVVR